MSAVSKPKAIIFYDNDNYAFPTEFYFIAKLGDEIELRKCNGGKDVKWFQIPDLHKEVTVDDDSGMITRRIGSPCATDNWHYQNRFVGATKKHQIFLWDKENGLVNIHYIPNKD